MPIHFRVENWILKELSVDDSEGRVSDISEILNVSGMGLVSRSHGKLVCVLFHAILMLLEF